MIYLSQLLGNPVLDADGQKIGVVNDLGIATGEVFPRITSLAFQGPGKTPFMISWRKYVDSFDEDEVHLTVAAADIRFSYLQPEEVLIARDLLNKQIVDTRGMKVVRVNDLKLSDTSSSQLRLLGAEVGVRGLLRTLSPRLEKLVLRLAHNLGRELPERIIAWNYMDLLDRDLSNVKLSVTHKTLDELHPADIADIIEQLDPRLRGQVFAQLDVAQAAEAIAELDDDQAAELMGDMTELDASRMLSEMDPDDAAELVSELDYEKAEKLLRLMGVKEQKAVRQLLGYQEDTAGRIMTSEAVLLDEGSTVVDAVEALRNLDEDFETVHYIYLKDAQGRLSGLVTLRALLCAKQSDVLLNIAIDDDLITANPEDDQEDVAENIAKYNLLAMPIVDDKRRLLGIVTVDDALDVLEEEHAEDLQIAGASTGDSEGRHPLEGLLWLLRNELWFFIWMGSLTLMMLLFTKHSWLDIVMLASMLPVAIVAGNDAANYVTNSFIEYDANDENAPSLFGFAFKNIGLGLLFAALVGLIATTLVHVISSNSAQNTLLIDGIISAVTSILISFALTPVYLGVLRKLDENNRSISGTSLTFIAMLIASLTFIATASILLCGVGM